MARQPVKKDSMPMHKMPGGMMMPDKAMPMKGGKMPMKGGKKGKC